jgi:hypothetical protein
VKLRAIASNGIETYYVRIDHNKLNFEEWIESVTNLYNNRRIFVIQGSQFTPLNEEDFLVEVRAGSLLDRGLAIRTGIDSGLQKIKYSEVVRDRQWMLRRSPCAYGLDSIAVEGSSETFTLNITSATSHWTMQRHLTINLLVPSRYVVPSLSRFDYPNPNLPPRRDRATLVLNCGDIVSATLK